MRSKGRLNHNYTSISYWLENYKDELQPRPRLESSETFDIAIVGAGFTGLWTAYYLSHKEPTLKIAILEKHIVGYGASGRNGGWCSPKFPLSPTVLVEKYGKEETKGLIDNLFSTITEVERVIKDEKIDVDWALSGSLQVALGKYGIPTLDKTYTDYKSLGFEDQFQILNEDETNERLKINGAVKSLLTKKSAVLDPGKLVRSLARILEKRGIKIYEKTEVIKVNKSNSEKPSVLLTPFGKVTAKVASVLAGEAYMSKISGFSRTIIPMYSLITLTEPLTEKQWKAIGWENRETVGSTHLNVNYLQRTSDGRILIGGRGQPYRFGSKINASLDSHNRTHKQLQAKLLHWFPELKGINFTHSWGGPVGVTRDWVPNINYDRKKKIASAWGFVGQGVSTTNLTGRILSDLILERESGLTKLPILHHKSKKWEVEPFRWMGVRFVQSKLDKLDRDSDRIGRIPNGKTLAERLSRR